MRTTAARLLVVALSGLILSRSGWQATPAIAESPTYFPLASGTYWVYRGTVKWTEGRDVRQREITWSMEVIREIRRDRVEAFQLRGHPGDLIAYEDDRQPGEYAILRVVPNKFYEVGLEVMRRLEGETVSLEGLFHESDIVLDFPLTPGKKFCEAEMMSRPDDLYCGVVEEGRPPSSWSIVGVPPPERVAVVRYGTLADEESVDFAEGLGIVRYRYVHHGTTSEVDVRLVDFHRGRGDH